MKREEIRVKVLEAVREWAGFQTQGEGEPITDESKLELDLGLDYLDIVELIMDIEWKLEIHIDDEEVEDMKTVGDVVKAAQDAVEGRGDGAAHAEQEGR